MVSKGASVSGPGPRVRRADGRRFLRDVDGHGAPGDAAAAADATGAAELVDPARQLVRHPLAVARAARLAHAAAMDVGMVEGEAGIPGACPLRLAPAEVGHVADTGAEAGWADQRAVATGQTAAGDIVPAGMLSVPVQQLLDGGRVERPAHGGRRARDRLGRLPLVLHPGLAV